jgi:cyclopropane fatty-acyl-phospholipid synthase-like methyltransferase
MPPSLLQKAAGALAGSPLLRHGQTLYAENRNNWYLPLSKVDKLKSGLWLILNDYSQGVFPPQFPDQQKAYQDEKNYRFSIPGITAAEVSRNNMTKPFWGGNAIQMYLAHFCRIVRCLEGAGVHAPAKVLELGCGGGWASEFLATTGYDVCGTTISEDDVTDAHRRVKSLEARGLSSALKFVASPMESAHTVVSPGTFDAVFIYEALHHAFDWRASLHSSHACLKPGGWMLVCNEPNVLHTYISYRVARLTNTHEIGFSKKELIAELQKTGFRNISSTGPKLHWWFSPHWLVAQK